MLATFSVMINYGQLIVYLPSVNRPGHIWGDDELDQGFAWSPGIISLGVPEHAFICRVDVEIISTFSVSPDAISCLRVPFNIHETPVYIGSVFYYESVNIDNGPYSLIYEVLPGEGTWEIESAGKKEYGENSYAIKLCLIPGEDDRFEIIKPGGAIHTHKILSRLSKLA
ncbi:competence protein ComJ [Rhizobium sp. CNPSo 4062]|uniref:competence protein ComJ n=1 Tax=Rhizobium sp. CNPSo 4062 TaxID=3021410 RepID=UPI0025506E82|nr:competence protein ComJ [Rhizobium sp. CNPSo 4062]MDK4706611.1 competence protein ComJ [Rhizobium sp. CNPSo 4062]